MSKKEFLIELAENQVALMQELPMYYETDAMMRFQDIFYEICIDNGWVTEQWIEDNNTGTIEDLYYDVIQHLKGKPNIFKTIKS